LRNRHTKDRRGFTLVEALVALAISLVIGLIMTSVMRIALRSWERAEERRKAVESAQLIMRQLREDFAALAVPGAILNSWQNPLPKQSTIDTFYSAPPDQPQCFLISDYPYYPRYYPRDAIGLGDPDEAVDLPEIAVPPWDTDKNYHYAGLQNHWKIGDDGPVRLDSGQRLVLVRRITPEDVRAVPSLRLAGNALDDDGDESVDEESYNLIDDDGDGLIDEDLAATGGLMAVTYILQPYRPDEIQMQRRAAQSGMPEVPQYTLRRGVQSPVGGVLISPAGGNASDWQRWPILADNVLYFGLRFQGAAFGNLAVKDRKQDDGWGPYDRIYDDVDTWPSEGSEPASPETMWDSTRGIYDASSTRSFYPEPSLFWPFPAPLSPNSFAFYRTVDTPGNDPSPTPSLATAADDIFPRRVHVVLVLDAGPHLSPRGMLRDDDDRGVSPHPMRAEGDLLPATTSASRGFAEGIRTVRGEPVDEFRERQHIMLLATNSYEWAHYRDTQRDRAYEAYRMDRTGQRGTSWKSFKSRQTLVVSGMTFTSEIDLPSYRAPEKGYGQ